MNTWNNKVKNELIQLGGKICTYDHGLFIWQREKELVGILGSHVNDFLFCGSTMFP